MIRNLLLITASALILTACGGGASTNETAKGNTTAPATPTASKWVETTAETPDGGFVMGNPDAKVKLIEYGALTCSHCADFSAESHSEIKELVAKGNFSFEFRPYLLSGIADVPATVLSRCNGPSAFFSIVEKVFAEQATWLSKLRQMPPEKQAALQNAKPLEVSKAYAEASGLIPFVQQLGVSEEKANACLSDERELQRLVDMMNKGTKEYKITGTPTFIINGNKVDAKGTWEDLKPRLIAAGA
jgi:protein-disulfide isomerase